uniref:Uncharacterized protein n=1 Tax=Cuerna arida TaxID=1464854 RepID=A0A1B6GQL6_9HEMI
MARVLLLLSLAGVIALALAKPEEKYTTKYDNINLDDFLQNARLMNKTMGCLMDQGGCTADIEQLKKVLPDALKNECSKCSEKQKEGARKVIRFLFENKKDDFEKLEKKYDPEGVYRQQYKDLAAKEGIKI